MSNTSKDQAGQIIIAPSLPPSGASTTILGSGGTRIPAHMVGGTAVADKNTGKNPVENIGKNLAENLAMNTVRGPATRGGAKKATATMSARVPTSAKQRWPRKSSAKSTPASIG